MRLLDLHPDVQVMVRQGQISVGHAKVLLSLKSHDEQKLLAEMVIRQSASVRATEKLAAAHVVKSGQSNGERKKAKNPDGLSPAVQRVENLLQHRLATRVVVHHGKKRGSITIEYYGNDDLQRILNSIGIESEE
jgi:ParB family chromosome partitioning protein